MSDYSEKRDFQRMAIDCELTFTVGRGRQQYEGNVINLSSQGILFTCLKSFAEDTDLNIVLTPSNSITPPLHASITVSRISDNGSLFELACKMNEIN
ncbi:MAG: hypothetical protein ACI845_002875 [Gammaproteobacteria bacterium]|jgi:hypothetical protein